MATRLIGTDSDDPQLPSGVGVTAAQTTIADAGTYYTGGTVEAALQEIGAGGIGGGGGGEGGIESTGPIEITAIWAGQQTDFEAVVSPDTNTLYIVLEDDP